MWNHFKLSEFECPCCNAVEMNHDFINKLDLFRHEMGFPFYINSGFRCASHNEAVGGKNNSAHLVGRAVDIKVSHKKAIAIVKYFEKYGFTGIGVYQSGDNRWIHLDDLEQSQGIPRPHIWSS